MDPLEIQLDEAVKLIEEKEKKDKENIIKTFEDEPELQVLNGRYGPYIKFEKSNYKIPKTTDPKELTIEDCKKIIEETGKDKKAKTKKSTADKKTAAKSDSAKTTAKKTTKKTKSTASKSAKKTKK